MPARPDAEPLSTRKLTSALAVGAALFVLALAGAAYVQLEHIRLATEQRAAREIDALARVFAEQTRRSLQTVDTMLRATAVAYRDGLLPALDSRQMHEQLVGHRDQVPDVTALFITDPRGARLNSSTAYPSTPASVAGDTLIRGLQARPLGDAYVGESVHAVGSGRLVVPLARRLERRDGRMDGVIGALLEASYFDNFYAAVDLERGTAVALLGEGDALVAQFPLDGSRVGEPVAAYRAVPRDGAAASVPIVAPASGRAGNRLAVARTVPGFGLTVVVSRQLHEVLALWRDQVVWVWLRTGIIALMVVALVAIVRRHLVRLSSGRARIRESEERYALAVAGSNEGLWDWNIATGELFLSDRAQRLCGLAPRAPLDSRRAWQARVLVHPDDVRLVRAAMRAHLDGRLPHLDVELRVAPGDDGEAGAAPPRPQWRWLRQRGVAIRNAGRAVRMAGSIESIDERKQSEHERHRLAAQLRQAQKLEAIGTLAGGIAHDFNNILGAILGYGELARAEAAPGCVQARYLEGVMNAAQRAKALVQRILAFSRAGMGERVPVHVQAVVSEALDLLMPSLPHEVSLARTLDADDVAVVGDATQIHQVVMNLCTNALQAMQEGGTLAVTLTRCRADHARTLATGELPAGDYVCLAVADKGHGIEPVVLDRIFDPFFTTKGVGVGTGLGLSLVHGIVSDLGGGIEVASRPGEGTTFTVWLPCSAEAAAPATADASVPAGAGERVLFVDDELALVQIGEEMLAALGYEPAPYTSSVDALAAFTAEPTRFDAVLSDETMPQLSGSQMAREMRRVRADIPIVLMSGYIGPSVATLARQANVDELLPKPLVSRDIAKALAKVFGKSS